MDNILDWILGKMRLDEEENEELERELESGTVEKPWAELVHWKKDKVLDQNGHVYIKGIETYSDGKLVIDHYKAGSACVFRFHPQENSDAQSMMNYICGGIYALDGTVVDVGENVFMTKKKGE